MLIFLFTGLSTSGMWGPRQVLLLNLSPEQVSGSVLLCLSEVFSEVLKPVPKKTRQIRQGRGCNTRSEVSPLLSTKDKSAGFGVGWSAQSAETFLSQVVIAPPPSFSTSSGFFRKMSRLSFFNHKCSVVGSSSSSIL